MSESIFFPAQTPTAKVTQGVLTLSLPNASQPVIWRVNVSDIKALSLKIVCQGEQYSIVAGSSSSELQGQVIAVYNTKEAALQVLLIASQALDSVNNIDLSQHMQSNYDTSFEQIKKPVFQSRPENKKIKHIIKPLLYIISVLILSVILLFAFTQIIIISNSQSEPAGTGQVKTGQSMSAEDFLQDR